MQDYLYANFHTHTTRCLHAVDSEREYIENAIDMGMKRLGSGYRGKIFTEFDR